VAISAHMPRPTMPDLYFVQDERHLMAKWDYLLAVFRIVARDYKRVIGGDIPHDGHHSILKQTVSDLLDVEADLFRVGKSTPTGKFDEWMTEAWAAAVAWVREFRTWQIPHEAMPIGDIEHTLVRRKLAENRFHAVICQGSGGGPSDQPTVLIHAA